MIKKGYIMAFVILFITVVGSTISAYKQDYKNYLEDSKITLRNSSNYSSLKYDKFFHETKEFIDDLVKDMDAGHMRSNEMDEYLEAKSQEVSYLDKLYILNGSDSSVGNFDNQSFYVNQNILYIIREFSEMKEQKVYIVGEVNRDKLDEIGSISKLVSVESHSTIVMMNGDIILHSEPRVIGMNLTKDSEVIMSILNMKDQMYSEYIDVILKRSQEKDLIEVDYTLNEKREIGYVIKLNDIEAVEIFSIDYTSLKDKQLKEFITNCIPLLFCLLIGTIVLIKYIYLIRFTDYFTEIKNKHAFVKYIESAKRTDKKNIRFLMLKIDNVLCDIEKNTYDNELEIKVSIYLKSLKSHYSRLFKLNSKTYLFVFQNSITDNEISELIWKINRQAVHDTAKAVTIKGKMFLFRINEFKYVKASSVDVYLRKYMEKYYKTIDLNRKLNYEDFKVIDEFNQEIINHRNIVERIILESKVKPYFQPIVDLEAGKVVRHESLMRVIEENQYYSPRKYISIAEEHDIVHQLDRIMINKVFFYYSKTLKNTGVGLSLNINLSGKSISSHFVEFIKEMSEKYYVNPEDILFELTETAPLRNLDEGLELLRDLKQFGFKLALDNFGVGYSNIKLLSMLELDFVKVDWLFIKEKNDKEKLLKTINALAYLSKNYKTKIIAKNIENKRDIPILRKLGVDYAQGNFIGKPEADVKYVR